MIGHERATQLAAFAIDLPLDPGERRQLGDHLASCGRCRAYEAGIRADAEALRQLRSEVAPPHLRASIAGSFGPRPAVRSLLDFGRAGLVLAVVALGSLLVALAVAGSGLRFAPVWTPSPSQTRMPGVTEEAPSPPRASFPPAGRIVASVPVGAGTGVCRPACAPPAVASAFGSVWVTALDAVVRLDPASADVMATIPTDGAPTRFTVGAGSLWVVLPGAGEVVRIDPVASRVVATVRVGRDPTALAFADGRLWVVSEAAASVVSIDAATDRVSATIAIPRAGVEIAAAGGSIWIATTRSGLIRLDAASDVLLPPVPGPCCELAAAGDTLWASDGGGEFWRVDGVSGRVVATLTADYSDSIATDGGALWAVNGHSLIIDRITASASPPVIATLDLSAIEPPGSANPYLSGAVSPAIALDTGVVWVRTYDPDLVLKVVPEPVP